MKRLLTNIVLFSAPLLTYVLIAICIDPYNVIHEYSTPRLKELKSQIAYKLSYPLYMLPKYAKNPTDIIILGDSRAGMMNITLMDSILKTKCTKLSFGGASLKEVIETFWYASKNQNLREVYIGVSFMQYNKYNQRNRVTEAVELLHSPLSYMFSSFCFKSTTLIIKSILTNSEIKIGVPSSSKEEFWKYQLENDAVVSYYIEYEYPEYFHEQLVEISNYCKAKNIKLVFFIPPTHTDLQLLTKKYNRVKENQRFIDDLSKIGLLYDFNYPNLITEDSNNFSDPHHLHSVFSDSLTIEIVAGINKYAQTD